MNSTHALGAPYRLTERLPLPLDQRLDPSFVTGPKSACAVFPSQPKDSRFGSFLRHQLAPRRTIGAGFLAGYRKALDSRLTGRSEVKSITLGHESASLLLLTHPPFDRFAAETPVCTHPKCGKLPFPEQAIDRALMHPQVSRQFAHCEYARFVFGFRLSLCRHLCYFRLSGRHPDYLTKKPHQEFVEPLPAFTGCD